MLAGNQFEEAWSLFDIAKAAERQIERFDERTSPSDCEVIPGTADWYLVQCFPGDDLRAMRWLARRRFGVYRPMQQRFERKSGRRVQGWEPVFPGWLFVYSWDIDKMSWRIVNCPGVLDILRDPATGRPYPIDQPTLTDDRRGCLWPRLGFVDRLRALSWVYDETAPALRTQAAIAGRRQERRRHSLGKAERKELRRLTEQAKAADIWDEEAWAHANELDPGQRIALLRRTLKSPVASGGPLGVNPATCGG